MRAVVPHVGGDLPGVAVAALHAEDEVAVLGLPAEAGPSEGPVGGQELAAGCLPGFVPSDEEPGVTADVLAQDVDSEAPAAAGSPPVVRRPFRGGGAG